MDNAYSGYWASFDRDTLLSGKNGALSAFDFTLDLIEKVSIFLAVCVCTVI
jgi:hypothetical protein